MVEVLRYLFAVRGEPDYIRSDNGPEFASKAEVSYTIGTNSVDKGPLIAMGRDITGDGIPNLVVHYWNG
ncbi:MAG: hypothetical protein ACYS83_11035, partial [Planctomycetota bacterium]